MENSRFPSSARVLFVLLCFFVCFSELSVFVNADDIVKRLYDKELNGVRLEERSDLCGTDISSFLPPPYNNISKIACTPVWNTFLLRYHRGEENVMTFILSAIYTTGWVGMGFSRDGKMVGSSAMVGWFNKKGQPKIKQFYLQGTERSKVIADAGELDLTKIPPAVVIHGAMIYLAFQAKFEKPLTKQPILLAFGTRYPNHHLLTHHDDKTAMLFDFSSGSASAKPSGFEAMKRNHGALAILSWGLLLPVGAIIARYLKHKDPLWYYLHMGFQFLGFLLGLGAVIVGQRMYEKMNAHIPAHRGIGILILTLSILQVLAFFLRPHKDAKIRRYWNWYHHWVGRTALFFGAVNIVVGIHVASAGMSLKIGFGFIIAMVLLAVIILETLSWLRRSKENNPPPTFQMNQF